MQNVRSAFKLCGEKIYFLALTVSALEKAYKSLELPSFDGQERRLMDGVRQTASLLENVKMAVNFFGSLIWRV